MADKVKELEEYPDLREFDYCPFCHRQPKPEDFEQDIMGFRKFLQDTFWNTGTKPNKDEINNLVSIAKKQFGLRVAEYARDMILPEYKASVDRHKREFYQKRKKYCVAVGIEEERLSLPSRLEWLEDGRIEPDYAIAELIKETNLYSMLLARLDTTD